jgi:hypothetical protein
MAVNEEVLTLLKSIDATMKAMLALAQKREAKVRAAAPKEVASDKDLDSKYGDPIIKFNPRDWTGRPYKGMPMSECPPEFLDLAAETLDYFASQAEAKNEQTSKGKPAAPFKRADAARARGWAQRLRKKAGKVNGNHAPAAQQWAEGEDRTQDANPWADEGGSFS